MKTAVKTRLLRGMTLLFFTITVPPSVAAVSWTATVVSSPDPAIVGYGHSISFWLEDEQFEVTGLPEGEYWMRGSTTEYSWSVNNGQITGSGSSATINSGAAGAVGVGQHDIKFEGRTEYYVCWLDENEEEHCDGPITVGWISFGSKDFAIVKVASVSCSGVTSTTRTPGDAETIHIAIAEENSAVGVSATPNPDLWPSGAPVWSIPNPDGSPSSGQTSVNAPTDSAGAFTISASCGTSAAAIILKVIEVYSLEPEEGEEIDDGDDDPDTRTFVVAAAETGVVTVNATPNPDVAEDKLPDGWTLTGGEGTSKRSRSIDRTKPGIYTLTCTCGTSKKTTEVIVIGVNLNIWNGGADLDNGQTAGPQGDQVPDADEETVGAYLLVNWDDDDGAGVMNADGSWSSQPVPDLYETSVANEDNLAKIQATVQPLLDMGIVELKLSGVDADKVKLWTQSNKGTQITMSPDKKTWNLAVPTEKADFQLFMTNGYWIEGIAAGTTERGIAFTLRYKDSNGTEICKDDTKTTVVMINLANAVYRDNMIWTQTARGHTAIVWKFDGPLTGTNLSDDTKFKIVEMKGPTSDQTLATITQNMSYPARGCYTSSTLTFVQRLKILKTALSLTPNGMGYPIYGGNALEPKNTWDGKLNTVTHLRCDGLVEMCYEINGVNVWGMQRIPDSSTVHYNISDQADNWDYNPVTGTWASGSNNECDNQEEHNDFDFTLLSIGDWADTLMPATQAGYVTPDSADTIFSSQDLCLPIGSKGGN